MGGKKDKLFLECYAIIINLEQNEIRKIFFKHWTCLVNRGLKKTIKKKKSNFFLNICVTNISNIHKTDYTLHYNLRQKSGFFFFFPIPRYNLKRIYLLKEKEVTNEYVNLYKI